MVGYLETWLGSIKLEKQVTQKEGTKKVCFEGNDGLREEGIYGDRKKI